MLAVTRLGDFLDWLLRNREFDGWNQEVLKIGAELKNRFPSLQFKAPAHIATIVREAPELFDVLYER
jgi:hypothetical protein